MRRQSKTVQMAAEHGPGQPFTPLPAAGVKLWDHTPHAIDATDNIDHLTRRALVRVEVGHVRRQDGLAADQRRRVPELLRDGSLDHISGLIGKAHLHV